MLGLAQRSHFLAELFELFAGEPAVDGGEDRGHQLGGSYQEGCEAFSPFSRCGGRKLGKEFFREEGGCGARRKVDSSEVERKELSQLAKSIKKIVSPFDVLAGNGQVSDIVGLGHRVGRVKPALEVVEPAL